MKKLLTILCAGILFVATPATMYAEDTEATAAGNQDVELTATVASSYSVKIPKSLDVSALSSTLNIFAKGDIAGNEELAISYTGTNVKLKDQTTGSSKADIDLTFSGEGVNLSYDDLHDAYQETPDMVITITHGALSSGSWKATLPITIALNTKKS